MYKHILNSYIIIAFKRYTGVDIQSGSGSRVVGGDTFLLNSFPLEFFRFWYNLYTKMTQNIRVEISCCKKKKNGNAILCVSYTLRLEYIICCTTDPIYIERKLRIPFKISLLHSIERLMNVQ